MFIKCIWNIYSIKVIINLINLFNYINSQINEINTKKFFEVSSSEKLSQRKTINCINFLEVRFRKYLNYF